MRLSQTITSKETESSARAAISAYLERAGFKPASSAPFLTYRRGSLLGSAFSFSPKSLPAKASVEIKPGPGEATSMYLVLDINTSGQIVTRKMRKFYEDELAGLVAAVGGSVPEATIGAEAQPVSFELQRMSQTEEQIRLGNQVKGGASWFFLIAGLSLLNSLLFSHGAKLTFVVGLAFTQFVDGLAAAIVKQMAPGAGGVVTTIGTIVNLGAVGLVALLGALARQRHNWAFVVGMVLYGLDALVLLLFGELWGVAFHLLALAGLFAGLRASRSLGKEQPVVLAA